MKLSDLKKTGYLKDIPVLKSSQKSHQFKGTSKKIKESEMKVFFLSKEELAELKSKIKISEESIKKIEDYEKWKLLAAGIEFGWMIYVKTQNRERLDSAIEEAFQYFLAIGKTFPKYEYQISVIPPVWETFSPDKWAREKTGKMCSYIMTNSNVFYN